MKITLWGVRGSTPHLSMNHLEYGGNTTCIQVETLAGDCIILDAGTGIHSLGTHLLEKSTKQKCSICFTHKHWDHIQGFTTFPVLYTPGWEVDLYTPKNLVKTWQKTFQTLFDSSYFPVSWEQIGEKITHHDEFESGESFHIGSALIETCPTVHPGGCTAYKITADNLTIFFSGDHEWGTGDIMAQNRLKNFMQDADIIIADSHFFDSEYDQHRGWGHSTARQWIDVSRSTKARSLILSHHHPDHTDEELDQELRLIYNEEQDLPFTISLAYEGMIINNQGNYSHLKSTPKKTSCPVCSFTKNVTKFLDYSVILESILTEARNIGQAEAGTIYLIDELDSNRLIFSYAQNEVLFETTDTNKMFYLDHGIPIENSSIAGFVALTRSPLNLQDVYNLPKGVTYTYNDSFDKKTSYKTISMCTIPLLDPNDEVVGVLQVINSKDRYGNIQPFSVEMQTNLENLALVASRTIAQNRMDNQFIMRLLETAALRDPSETAMHVLRVGAISAEIYHRLALSWGEPVEKIRTTKDFIRQAAMLHDVGKVAIPDALLKKPGSLTPEEYSIMQTHSAAGANIFRDKKLRIDIMAHNVCLHHHQRFDGSGYTGDHNSPPLSGTDIPIEARIVSVADVYDALRSKRCYKDAIAVEPSLAIIKAEAGKAFDPEVVNAFVQIHELVENIMKRYED